MQDRPTSNELLDAIAELLIKEVLPAIKNDEALSYKTLVAWNMLGVVSREIKSEDASLSEEFHRLSEVLKNKGKDLDMSWNELLKSEKEEKVREMNSVLAEIVRQEKLSNKDSQVWDAVKSNLKKDLEISNPRFGTEKEK
ncbi:MAG: hypothetical protein H7A24_16030 [Leptospiraceae bacterium]|nr:hypothetical protein [Leptospiraceae bacterium]MCP5513396.1 hypothetical protein [Leptospiraceae bacterium]